MARDICELDLFGAAYLEFSLILPIVIILQILLLANTIYYEFLENKKYVKGVSLQTRLSFIILQISALIWTVFDFLRFTVDPWTLMLRHNAFCEITVYAGKVITFVYYAIYIYQILLRLTLSFKDSFLEISNRTYIILFTLFVIGPLIVVPIMLFPFFSSPCIWKWKPVDIPSLNDNNDFAFCSGRIIGFGRMVVIIGILWVTIANIVVGVIFGYKIKKVMTMNRTTNQRAMSFKIKSLMVKNTILTLIASCSTTVNWILWIIISGAANNVGAFLLYIDLYLNCVIIALMFKYNEKYYKKLCKCCIIICLMNCDKTYDRDQSSVIKKRENKILRYLDKVDLSSIFSSSTNLVSIESDAGINAQMSDKSDKLHLDQHLGLHEKSPTPIPDAKRVLSVSDMISDVDANTHIDLELSDDDDNDAMDAMTPPISPAAIANNQHYMDDKSIELTTS